MRLNEASLGCMEHRGVPPEYVGFRVDKGFQLKAACGGNGVCCFAKIGGF